MVSSSGLDAPFGETVIDCPRRSISIAALAQSIGDRSEMRRLDALERDPLAGDRAGDEERAGLDAVRDDVVLGAVQFLHAFDDDAARAGAFDLRAHLVEEIREIDDLRFGAALSITVVPSARTAAIITLSVPSTVGPNLPRRLIDRAAQLRRENLHVAALDAVRRAQGFEAL